MEWAWPFWVWVLGILAIFLPMELYAAIATKGATDTFSEFVWWAFGVRPRKDGKPVRWRAARRFTLGAFLFALYLHLVFGVTVIPVIIFAPLVGGTILYALVRERRT